MMDPTLIVPLDAETASLALVGGKGANLARLARAGFPVPGGFMVTTAAYAAYVAANDLVDWVPAMAAAAAPGDPTAPGDQAVPDAPVALEAASQAIRARFAAGVMPPDLADALTAAYAALGRPAVAVRSSATAEDLPDLSFAGQQDTFLNVVGDEALLRAVVDCWSSLWTARAIGYRARNGIPQTGLALAVVVQAMVQSEASGVLFTANPLTGLRTETVIDATLGLGEALVSGRVDPDHYVVDMGDGNPRIAGKTLGRKAIAIHGQTSGGTVTTTEDAAGRQALPDAAILELAGLGRRVADLYGAPQDIEWAWADGRLYLVQSRPITSLYPVPANLPAHPLHVLLSFGAVQGALDPMTPLGRETLQGVAVIVGRFMGVPVTLETQRAFLEAGERLFINVTTVINNQLGRRILGVVLPYVEPGSTHTLASLLTDPHLAEPGRLRPHTVWLMFRFLAPLGRRVLHNLRRPEESRARTDQQVEQTVTDFAARAAAAETLADRLALFQAAGDAIPRVVLAGLLPALVGGMAMMQLLHRLAAGLALSPGDQGQMVVEQVVLELTRGLPRNVTTEMDLALWAAAQAIQADPDSAARFAGADAPALAADWLAGRLPPAAQAAADDFMRRYGARGLGEIDLGRPRWRDEPTPVFQVLQSYLRITDPSQAPDAVFARGAAAAEATLERIVAAARQAHGGRVKSRLVRFAAGRMRALLGIRESPKFFAVRMMGIWREALLQSGQELVTAGVLARPDDVFFLRMRELEALATRESRDWQALVAERRQAFDRELRRRQVPRILLSDGRAFYEGMGADTAGNDELVGSPVSPGVAEGVVHVVLDPRGAQLAPGEILVCPGTDPAWTPLFLAAGGLIMEVGGLMTHGAVVAREYGIPAVAGVHQATTRLQTGQRIRVDGSTGQIRVVAQDTDQ
ncbi:MAG: phosphoenolpyruvate synthase [Chloroflexi bacterium]|nr:phosphoenolpyruvate synthase [Chloroflexota bacterium]MBU1750534.1 phosphoenolpyruvate synthase [Chloroflexota bacterium]